MTERPLCRDVSLRAARECLTDAASYAAAALLELRDAAGFALIALAQGPTTRAIERPMPAPSAEAEVRFAEMMLPSFAALFDARCEWSRETFGPGDRAAGVVAHIRKELAEIEAEPSDLEEWVDVIILAMDGAWRSAGADGAACFAAIVAKDAKNRARKWPDRRTHPLGAATEHVREPVCVCGDYPVTVGEPCAACAETP